MEKGLLKGKYFLKSASGRPVSPEYFLDSFKGKPFYEDVCKFVRRVDNDTGIPFLTKNEFKRAVKFLPKAILPIYEAEGFVSSCANRVYLRGRRYFLNYQDKGGADKRSQAEFALDLLRTSIFSDIDLHSIINYSVENAKNLEERMVAGSFLDLYKNHLMVLFTGLYESMREDESISDSHYVETRSCVEKIIDGYYSFIIQAKRPKEIFPATDKLAPVFDAIGRVISKTNSIYEGRRYLSREFDHPGRIVLYAGHLLSQIKDKNKKYDLLVNLLNGSAEIGLAVQTIDRIIGTNNIETTAIFEVDFARYSRQDRRDADVSSYDGFEKIAIPKRLRHTFRKKVQNKHTLLIDDNLNTGKSLYNVSHALREIALSVDISVVEVTPFKRVIELIRRQSANKGGFNEIKLTESDLTYAPIGWWRDQVELVEKQMIKYIIQ